MLLSTNSKLTQLLEQTKNDKSKIESQMLKVFQEANALKQEIDAELQQYEQAKTKMQQLERQNVVLWKYIKKQFKKLKKQHLRDKRRKVRTKELTRALKTQRVHGLSISIDQLDDDDEMLSEENDSDQDLTLEEIDEKFSKIQAELDMLANDPNLI